MFVTRFEKNTFNLQLCVSSLGSLRASILIPLCASILGALLDNTHHPNVGWNWLQKNVDYGEGVPHPETGWAAAEAGAAEAGAAAVAAAALAPEFANTFWIFKGFTRHVRHERDLKQIYMFHQEKHFPAGFRIKINIQLIHILRVWTGWTCGPAGKGSSMVEWGILGPCACLILDPLTFYATHCTYGHQIFDYIWMRLLIL